MLDEVELKRLGAALGEPLAPGGVAMILRLGGGFQGFFEWWSAHKAGSQFVGAPLAARRPRPGFEV